MDEARIVELERVALVARDNIGSLTGKVMELHETVKKLQAAMKEVFEGFGVLEDHTHTQEGGVPVTFVYVEKGNILASTTQKFIEEEVNNDE